LAALLLDLIRGCSDDSVLEQPDGARS